MAFDLPQTGCPLPDTFLSALEAGRLSHAVLLEGADHESRYALARYAAAALVCKGVRRPCGVCADCVKAAAASHPDIIEVGGDDAKTLSVDRIREIRRTAYVLPNEADRKVYILRGADTMTEQAQNALLKILEEPPAFVAFILECPSGGALLPTVLSRCDAWPLGDEKGAAADGEKRDKAREAAKRLAAALCGGSEWVVMAETGVFEKDKALFRACLSELVSLLRGALLAKYVPDGGDPSARALAATVTQTRLLGLIDAVNGCILSMEANTNHNLLITRFVSTTAAERIF